MPEHKQELPGHLRAFHRQAAVWLMMRENCEVQIASRLAVQMRPCDSEAFCLTVPPCST